MPAQIELDEDELDCLQELMNIAYGSATAAISELIDAFATLNIPDITIIPANDLKNYLTDKLNIRGEQFVAKQIIDGDLTGENLFLIDTQSAINLARQFDLEEDEIDDEDLYDVVLEVTNILSSSTIGRLAEELEGSVSFLPPNVQKIDSINELSDNFTAQYDQIFAISTELAFEEQTIRGELLFLTKDEYIGWLKIALNKILDEL